MNKLMTRIGVGTATVAWLPDHRLRQRSCRSRPPDGGRIHYDHHARAAGSGHRLAQGVPLRGHHYRWRHPDAGGWLRPNEPVQPGQVVVFRMDGVDAAAGGIDLTPARS